MPAFIGPVQIITIDGGNVQFGDALNISPKNNSKTEFRVWRRKHRCIHNDKQGISATNNFDTNLIDQPNVGNN